MPQTPFFTAVTFRTVSPSVAIENRPVRLKPVTVRLATVTPLTFSSFVPITQMPLPPSAQVLSVAFSVLGLMTVARPVPRRVSPGVLTLTLSWYVPGVTRTVSPGSAASTAFWIDPPGWTTWVMWPADAGAAPSPVPIIAAVHTRYTTWHFFIFRTLCPKDSHAGGMEPSDGVSCTDGEPVVLGQTA